RRKVQKGSRRFWRNGSRISGNILGYRERSALSLWTIGENPGGAIANRSAVLAVVLWGLCFRMGVVEMPDYSEALREEDLGLGWHEGCHLVGFGFILKPL